MDSLSQFRNLCSLVQDEQVRLLLEEWLVKNVRTYQVEARVSRENDRYHGALQHFQESTLAQIISGTVESAAKIESKHWMQGEHRMGTILTRKIHILLAAE